MPKQVFKIAAFNAGIISSPSSRDIPDGAFTFANNVDTRVPGTIRGIEANTLVTASFKSLIMTPLLGQTDYLIGQNGSKVFEFYNLTGSTYGVIGSAQTNWAKTLVPVNHLVYASMVTTQFGTIPAPPKVVANLDQVPFDIGTTGFHVTDAECRSYAELQNFSSTTDPLITMGNVPFLTGTSNAGFATGYETGVFQYERRYFYAVSLVYDSYQESPLIFGETDGKRWFVEVPVQGGADYIQLNLRVGFATGSLNRRVTGFKIYRASGQKDSESPDTFYSLVKYIEINNTTALKFLDTAYVVSSVHNIGGSVLDSSFEAVAMVGDKLKISNHETVYTVTDVTNNVTTVTPTFTSGFTATEYIKVGFNEFFTNDGGYGYPSGYTPANTFHVRIKDEGQTGADYLDNTGIPETLETSSIDYALSVAYSNYLFVTGVLKEEIVNSEKYLFRSKANAYSLFDWSNDFTILPESVTAMAGFNGRLYVFSSANTYRVNPITLEVEDVYSGVGALNENCVVVTNYGMFHADEHNVYINNGRSSASLGNPILEMAGGSAVNSGWIEAEKSNVTNADYAKLQFDPVHKRLLCFISINASVSAVWAYDVEYNIWSFFDSFKVPKSTAVGPSGTVYAVSLNGAVLQLDSLFTSATRKLWSIRTKDFDLGSDSGDFYGYDIHGYGTGNFTISYRKNGGSKTSPGTTTVNGLRVATVQSADKKMKSIAVEVDAAAVTDELDNLTIQVRPQIMRE